MNIFLDLPVPSANGSGASVNVSAMGQPKTVSLDGDLLGAVIVEYSNDDVTFVPLFTFSGPGKRTFSLATGFMRCTVNNYQSGSANCDVAANDNGTQLLTAVAPAGDGVGASLDVSALGTFNTIVVGGTFTGNVIIEISEDGVDFVDCLSFGGVGGKSKSFVAQFLRVRRESVVAPAGLPTVIVAAVNDPVTAASLGAVAEFIFQPGGTAGGNVFTDWTALAAAVANAPDGLKYVIFDDAVTSPIVLPTGAFPMPDVVFVPRAGGQVDPLLLNIPDGCTLDGLAGVGWAGRRMNITKSTAGSGIVVTDTSDRGSFVIDNAVINGSTVVNGGAFYSHDAGTNLGETRVEMRTAAQVLRGAGAGDPALRLGVTDDMTIELYEGSADDGSIFGAAGSNLVVNLRGGQAIASVQTTVAAQSYNQIDDLKVGPPTDDPSPPRVGELNRYDTTGGGVVETIPLAADSPGGFLIVKKTAGANTVTLNAGGSDSIDGAASLVIGAGTTDGVILVSDGDEDWHAIANFT